MLDRLTVLELTGAALAVLAVLHVIARIVNRSRTKVRPPVSNERAVGAVTVATPAPRDAVAPASKAIAPAKKSVAGRSPRHAKPRVVRAAGLKSGGSRTISNPKTKRRPKGDDAANGRRIGFAPVTKAKPALTRRPKRTRQIRRKKIVALQGARAKQARIIRRAPSRT